MIYRTVLKVSLLVMSCAAIGCDSDDDSSNAAGAGGAMMTGGAGGTTGGAGGASASGGVGGTGSGGTGTAGVAGMMNTSGTGGMSSGGTGAAGSGSGGAGGMAGDDAGMGGMGAMDLGEGDGQDVVTICDSWMNLNDSDGIQQSLEAISGRDYRNYAIPGTIVLSDDANQIPGQYYGAAEEDADIKTVIMTAGGNDVLQGNCLPSDCAAIIDEVGERLQSLMADMAEDGVEDVIFVGYAVPPMSFGVASTEYARMKIPMQCNGDSLPRCHYVDTQDELSSHISGDGIHPTPEGYDMLGQIVWDAMQAAGVRR